MPQQPSRTLVINCAEDSKLLLEFAGQTPAAKAECRSSANLVLSIESKLLHPLMQTIGIVFRYATVADRNTGDPKFRIKTFEKFLPATDNQPAFASHHTRKSRRDPQLLAIILKLSSRS
jgi:hypothetical protein